MLTNEKQIMIFDFCVTNLAAAAAQKQMFWMGIKVFERYGNNVGYSLLRFRHEQFDIEKMTVFIVGLIPPKKHRWRRCGQEMPFEDKRNVFMSIPLCTSEQ